MVKCSKDWMNVMFVMLVVSSNTAADDGEGGFALSRQHVFTTRSMDFREGGDLHIAALACARSNKHPHAFPVYASDSNCGAASPNNVHMCGLASPNGK